MLIPFLLVKMQLNDLDDNGMYIWAGILTVVSLVASYGVAIAWQRWKDKQKAA